MSEWGACGVGQSSWGPTVYGIVGNDDAGGRLADRVRALLGVHGFVYHGAFRSTGARIWRPQTDAGR
jgi:predicted sugar kinase